MSLSLDPSAFLLVLPAVALFSAGAGYWFLWRPKVLERGIAPWLVSREAIERALKDLHYLGGQKALKKELRSWGETEAGASPLEEDAKDRRILVPPLEDASAEPALGRILDLIDTASHVLEAERNRRDSQGPGDTLERLLVARTDLQDLLRQDARLDAEIHSAKNELIEFFSRDATDRDQHDHLLSPDILILVKECLEEEGPLGFSLLDAILSVRAEWRQLREKKTSLPTAASNIAMELVAPAIGSCGAATLVHTFLPGSTSYFRTAATVAAGMAGASFGVRYWRRKKHAPLQRALEGYRRGVKEVREDVRASAQELVQEVRACTLEADNRYQASLTDFPHVEEVSSRDEAVAWGTRELYRSVRETFEGVAAEQEGSLPAAHLESTGFFRRIAGLDFAEEASDIREEARSRIRRWLQEQLSKLPAESLPLREQLIALCSLRVPCGLDPAFRTAAQMAASFTKRYEELVIEWDHQGFAAYQEAVGSVALAAQIQADRHRQVLLHAERALAASYQEVCRQLQELGVVVDGLSSAVPGPAEHRFSERSLER